MLIVFSTQKCHHNAQYKKLVMSIKCLNLIKSLFGKGCTFKLSLTLFSVFTKFVKRFLIPPCIIYKSNSLTSYLFQEFCNILQEACIVYLLRLKNGML